MNHLDQLESQSVYILREAFNRIDRLAMLWSLGKDSNVMVWLARKAFFGHVPFPVMHIDTGQNFPEVIEFRDNTVARLGARLVVAKVQDTIDQGKVQDPGAMGSRNRLQTVTLPRSWLTTKHEGDRVQVTFAGTTAF